MIMIMSDWLSDVFDDQPRRSLEDGQRLFWAGDAVVSVFLVLSGRVDLVRVTQAGDDIAVQRAGPGTILAEASVYSPAYHCDAVARTDTTVAQIDKDGFKERLATNRAWSEAWASSLAHSVQQARLKVEVRSLKRVADRLDFLLEVEPRALEDRQTKEIAMDIGVSPEALYRELGKRRRNNPK